MAELISMLKKALYLLLLVLTLTPAVLLSIIPKLHVDLSFYEQRSPSLIGRDGALEAYTLASDGRLKLKTTAEEVDPLYLRLLSLIEDERFARHPGVDLIAVLRASFTNLMAGRIVSGASTLAMQTARILHPQERTLKAKISEAASALTLTSQYSRQGLLSIYLTVAPMGGYLHGVKAASLRFFGHDPLHLSPAEAALLVALPQNPQRLRLDIKTNHPYALQERNQILKRALEAGVISDKVYKLACQEPLPKELKPICERSYHLGRRIFSRAKKTLPKVREFYSTLDPRLQELLANEAKAYGLQIAPAELAVTIIDDLNHELAAYLGSSDPVHINEDLNAAIRSPGSTLKPFAYAQALSSHLAHPKTILDDRLFAAETYRPQNFSGLFQGELTVSEALMLSLNIPALEILKRVGAHNFVGLLNSGQKRIYLPKGSTPSLPVVLGGCGIRPYDLTVLYSALNQDGLLRRPKLFCLDKGLKKCFTDDFKPFTANDPGIRLFERSSARAVFEILQKTARPVGYSQYQETAFKTGTSHNFKDALACGSLNSLSACVFTGRRDGLPNPPHTGFEQAAPLLFAILSKSHSPDLNKSDLPREGSLSLRAPENLKKLSRSLNDTLTQDLGYLDLIYPGESETVYVPESTDLALEVKGSAPPFFLIYQGRIIDKSLSGRLTFPKINPGFYSLRIRDSAGSHIDLKLRIVQEL